MRDAAKVRDLVGFSTFVTDLIDGQSATNPRTLEEYLRSVLFSVNVHLADVPSYGLFAKVLEDGFLGPPTPYDEAWGTHDKPVRNPWLVYSIPKKYLPKWFTPDPPEALAAQRARISDRDLALDTLLFLIADFHSMTAKELGYKWRHMGSKSPRGHDWYNWDPFTFIECGLAGFMAHARRGHILGTTETTCNWAAFALLLNLGRVYE